MTPTWQILTSDKIALLDINRAAREGTIGHKNPEFGQHTLRIPMDDFHALYRLYPGLIARDPDEKSAAWEAFHNSPFAERYRLNRLSRGYLHNGLIIK